MYIYIYIYLFISSFLSLLGPSLENYPTAKVKHGLASDWLPALRVHVGLGLRGFRGFRVSGFGEGVGAP